MINESQRKGSRRGRGVGRTEVVEYLAGKHTSLCLSGLKQKMEKTHRCARFALETHVFLLKKKTEGRAINKRVCVCVCLSMCVCAKMYE